MQIKRFGGGGGIERPPPMFSGHERKPTSQADYTTDFLLYIEYSFVSSAQQDTLGNSISFCSFFYSM